MFNKQLPVPSGPRPQAERMVTIAAALLVALGSILAIAAWCAGRRVAPQGVHPHPTPVHQPSPAPTGPLSGLTILVDAGHGGYDGGARCRDSGIWEKHLNLNVALAVENSLSRRGATVIMTRRTDMDLCEEPRPQGLTKKRQDMLNRVAMATDHNADMVLSIHMNEYRSRAESGPQVFYRAGSEASRLLAGCLQDALITGLSPQRTRAALPGDYFILQLEVPSALVECGFISNPAEEKLLLDEAYQSLLGEAIADGVCEFLRLAPDEGE